MVFLEQTGVVLESLFEDRPEGFIANIGLHEPVPTQYSARVGVHHEDGFLAGVEENVVGRFGADPVDREELLAQGFQRTAAHPLYTAPVLLDQVGTKTPEAPGLHPEKTRRVQGGF